MKYLAGFTVLLLLWSCGDDGEKNDLTGNEVSYTLFSGSEFGYSGVIFFREKRDGFTRIEINLEGPAGESVFPAHLHHGSFDTPDAAMAALLEPVDARNGISVTELRFLADDSEITYEALEVFDGHIKVHLDDGANRDVIIAYGNIGVNMPKLDGEAAPCEGPN